MEKDIRKTRKHGNSIVISLTGFVELDRFYRIEKKENGSIVLTEVEV